MQRMESPDHPRALGGMVLCCTGSIGAVLGSNQKDIQRIAQVCLGDTGPDAGKAMFACGTATAAHQMQNKDSGLNSS